MKIHPIVLILIVLFCLALGGGVGFFAGLASSKLGLDTLKAVVSDEATPAIASPAVIDRASFTVKHPSNWKIDTADGDYDPDHMFSIESPGSAFVMFVKGKGESDADSMHKDQLESFNNIMDKPTRAPFTSYGGLTGTGTRMEGRILGSKTIVRIFSYSKDGVSLMITEQYPSDDKEKINSGLELIEKSFKLKPAAPAQP
jgi:hypothetical protein